MKPKKLGKTTGDEKRFYRLLDETMRHIGKNDFDNGFSSYFRLRKSYDSLSKKVESKKRTALHKELVKAHNSLVKIRKPKKAWAEGEKEKSIEIKIKNPFSGLADLLKKRAENNERKTLMEKRKHKLRDSLVKAGYDIDPKNALVFMFRLCILLNFIISAYLLFYLSNKGYSLAYIAVVMVVVWLLLFFILLFALWAMLYLVLDLRTFKRKVDLENVLSDFLQLTSANIKAGMSVEKALWYAVRPRFGVLAKEIETVAKDVMGGEDLKDALATFSEKYDSPVLSRSVSLIVEGMNAGGEMGDLLNRIALNIQESSILMKEMAANVTTYVIFISFATVLAAPFLFALSGQLIKVVQELSSKMSMPSLGGMGMAISFSAAGIKIIDFKIFAITTLVITSFFSSMIIATIKKGNIKEGIRTIPLFIISTIVLFFLASMLLERILGGFF